MISFTVEMEPEEVAQQIVTTAEDDDEIMNIILAIEAAVDSIDFTRDLIDELKTVLEENDESTEREDNKF